MNLAHPLLLLWLLPLGAVIFWARAGSTLPETRRRRRALLVVRLLGLFLLLLALAEPVVEYHSDAETVVFVLDHSRSLGSEGVAAALERVETLRRALPPQSRVGIVAGGASPRVLQPLAPRDESLHQRPALAAVASQSDLAAALFLATDMLSEERSGRIVLLSDGIQTRGDLLQAARAVARTSLRVDIVPIRGRQRPDCRLLRLRSSQAQLRRGATLALTAEITCTVRTRARVRLFENGLEVEKREIELQPGRLHTEIFERRPAIEGALRYLARVETLSGQTARPDAVPENDIALSQVDVHAAPRFMLLAASADEASLLVQAMATEGIDLQVLAPAAFPTAPPDLEAYEGVLLLNVPAKALPPHAPESLRRYVYDKGGGFVMIGGAHSFALGGYDDSPIEDLLPVELQPQDKHERYTTALVLVLDRSGSMDGVKIELSKSAAVAAAGVLKPEDHIGVVAFDSVPMWIIPLTRADQKDEIRRRIATLNAGGGTNLEPAMQSAYDALKSASARVKHMIILTDGRTKGAGYEELARKALADDITISTVGIGVAADNALLTVIAGAGGGKHYVTDAPTQIPRIFAEDTAAYAGDLLRQHAFRPQEAEPHAMLEGWNVKAAPELLGYVLTRQRRAAATPLLTDRGDPLLAQWRYGRGKSVAFTSGATARWARHWIEEGETYTRFWAQVLRDVARSPTGDGLALDLRRTPAGLRITVDFAEVASGPPASRDVSLDVAFAPPTSLHKAPRSLSHGVLKGAAARHLGTVLPVSEAGLYVVRVSAGDETVTRTFALDPSSETTSGALAEDLLEAVARLTQGRLLAPGEALPRRTHALSRGRLDLVPWLLRLFLLVFLLDLGIRRWPYALGLSDRIATRFKLGDSP